MAEKIKEIFEALKPHNDIKEYPLYLNRKQQDLLLDYITNLQQETETLKAKLEIGKTCGFCPYYDYKQENKKLKEKINNLEMFKYNIPNDKTKTVPTITKSYKNEYEDYKSRCEKAIEYIKMYKCDYSPYELTDSAIRNVLNILNGSDEND